MPGTRGQGEAVIAKAYAALGVALGGRAVECARIVDARMEASRWVGIAPSRQYLERRQESSWFATLLVARWLVIRAAADDAEMAWTSIRGRAAAEEGLSIINVARGYLVWRDTAIEILREEARRLETPPAVLAAAVAAVRSSCDAGMMRMNAEFDRQLQKVIEERKQLEEQLRHRALHDELTGLANRTLFTDRLTHAIERQARGGSAVAVMVIDVDDFKTVNDNLGHAAGDSLLIEVARRLRNSVRTADTVARLGGDEFAVVLERVTDVSAALETAGRMLEAFDEGFTLAERPVTVTASIGLAMAASASDDAGNVVHNADIAMYVAKASGKARYTVFTPGMQLAVDRGSRPQLSVVDSVESA